MKRITHKEYAPDLKIHNYIVAIGRTEKNCHKIRYKYCVNKKEVIAAKKYAKPNSVVEIFKAKHTFVEAFHNFKV